MLQGNPINSATGNKYQREVDYVGSGAYPLQAERFYNSGGTAPWLLGNTPAGSGWSGSYNRAVGFSTATPTVATAIRASGTTYTFHLSNGTWGGDGDVVGHLTETVSSNGMPTGWTYVNDQDETEIYNAGGQLTSITNRAGLVQTFAYSDGTSGTNGGYVLDANGNPTTTVLPAGKLIRVTDPAGHTLQYGYDASSRVVRMTDPAGGIYHYAYDANSNLTSVSYPDGKTKTYLYGEPANVAAAPNAGVSYVHSLTGIVDENNNRFASWTYDAAGRATSSEHGAFGSGIEKVVMSFGTPDANGNSTTSVTDVMGVTRSYNFSTYLGVVKNTGITGQPCDGCTAAFAFDSNGNVARRTDFKGNSSCHYYDWTRNLETSRLEGLPPGAACPAACAPGSGTCAITLFTFSGAERQITTQWHPTYRLPTVVTEPLRTTTYIYNGDVIGGTVITNSNGVTSVIGGTTVTCGFKADGITPVPGLLCRKTVQATTDATGAQGGAAAGTPRTWNYTYNAAGQVLTVDGPRTDVADITRYAYDAQGNLTTVTNALNQVTTIGGYDANGRPSTITGPNGLITNLTYDARGRLISRSRGGETTSYTYDGAGNLTNVSLPTGASFAYTYDAAHRLTQIADAQNNRLVYTLDNAGNRTNEKVYNSAGTVVQTHSRVFDTLNHLVQDIGAVNQTTVYTYDANGNVLTVTDPLNRLTTNAYDALDRLNRVINPDNGVIQYAYDNQNQLTTVTDPRNLVTQYTRDGLGNLNQQTSPDTGATNLTYDAAGNVLTRTDAKGQTATYTYDILNRVSTITYTGGTAAPQAIAYQYDTGANGIGHLTGITDSTGVTNYAYDQHGRLTTETEQAYGGTYATAYAYDAQGRLSAIGYPSGRVIVYSFDAQGRISRVAGIAGGNTTVLASNITYEPFGGVHSFTYGDGLTAPVQTYTRQRDQDGRIASYTLNGSRTMSILYDAASQITTISDSQNLPNPASYTYDPMSRLTGYLQGATNQGFSYDVDGNRVSQTIGATTTTYTLGATSNWLTGITAGGGAAQTVSHDANGATTLDASKSNQYSYDLRGRLTQTTTSLGVVNYEINALGLRTRKQVPYANTDTLYHYDLWGHLISENPNGTAQPTLEYIYLGDQPIAVAK